MYTFIRFLNGFSRLSQEAQTGLAGYVKTFEFAKNQTILKQGQICNHLYFVDKGLLRLFYFREGKDITDYFATEQTIIGGIDSFFSRQPSEKMIETIEPCTLTAISFDNLENLYAKHHDLERVGRILSINAFLSMQKRLYSLQFHSAKQRYQELIDTNPDILQRVPLGHVASYLGITQVTLSRIRGQK